MNDDCNSTRTNRLDERMDDILTLREVAELLRVPEGTLRYWRFCQAARSASKSVATSDMNAGTSISGFAASETRAALMSPDGVCQWWLAFA